MIYTVTLNPSYDYTVSVKDFKPHSTNRTDGEALSVGGKGINVSFMLKNLGFESTALGFAAGFTGEAIQEELEKRGLCCDFISVKQGFSRINIKFREYEGTEINGRGPEVAADELDLLMDRFSALEAGDIVVLAGSVPTSLSKDIYGKILERGQGKNIRFIVDASGELLLNALKYRPFLIKPNLHELGELFGAKVTERKHLLACARRLKELGAQNVLVSMAGDGAMLVDTDDRIYEAPAPKGTLVNGVGAGDAMVAGFLAGFLEKGDYEHAFYMGLAAGSASAFCEGFAAKDEIVKYLPVIHKT